jgi:hypothetical protein
MSKNKAAVSMRIGTGGPDGISGAMRVDESGRVHLSISGPMLDVTEILHMSQEAILVLLEKVREMDVCKKALEQVQQKRKAQKKSGR